MISDSSSFDLHEKRIVITGASSGIGAAIARLLAEHGAVIGIHYHRHVNEAQLLIDQIRSTGGKAEGFQVDLTDFEERKRLIPFMLDKLGGLDGFVNNAGAPQGQHSFPEITQSEWDQTLALNVEAPFFLAQQAFAHMKSNDGGRIINISSIGVKYGGSARTLHYAMAKSALETLTIGMAKLGAPFNVLVNTVRVGVIDTPFWKNKTEEEFKNRIKLIPLGRSGKSQDVAEMIHFLLTPQSSFITGQIFTVSGGE
ncbi:MAG: SDR family oxidoreductase [Anaerolineales bacterium]